MHCLLEELDLFVVEKESSFLQKYIIGSENNPTVIITGFILFI